MAAIISEIKYHQNLSNLFTSRYKYEPAVAPASGPENGTQAYSHSDGPLPLMGNIQCANRGPRSLAGFAAKPVGPPQPSPNTASSKPMRTPAALSSRRTNETKLALI